MTHALGQYWLASFAFDTDAAAVFVERNTAVGMAGAVSYTAALRQGLVLPDDEPDEGRVLVESIVDRTGEVREAKVKSMTSPILGAAVLATVKKLPRFKRGMQNGEATNVRLLLPVSFASTR